MDQQGSNKKKAKNWLYRFLKIKNRLHDRSSVSDIDSEVSRRYAFEHPDSKPHRNSFRKSLKKMHSRVKSCMFSQENNTPKRPVTVTDLPCSSQLSEYEIYRNTTPPPVPHRPQMPGSSEFYYASAIPQRRSCTPPLATDGPPVVQEPPRVSPPRESPPLEVRTHRIPTDEIVSLSNCYWYWGPMPTAEAEEKLQYKPDGTFLVRDSASTNYLFSISFRSVGKTMHARIEYSRGRYNLCGTYAEGFATVTELIRDAMKTSENGIYCYSRRGEQAFEFPVRLTKPISRYTEVRSLKHLCKFTIRQYTNMNDIPKLPLPTVLHGYLLEKPYF